MSTLLVRKLDASGDPIFGHGLGDFHTKSNATAHKIRRRLVLNRGEFFLDISSGLPWRRNANNKGTAVVFEGPADVTYASSLIKQIIMNTTGVESIESFTLDFNSERRTAFVVCSVKTDDGDVVKIEVNLP